MAVVRKQRLSLSLSDMLCTGNKYSVINNGKKMVMVGR